MAKVTDIGTLIVRTPEIRGGRPRIAGTGVTVRRIVGWYKLGLSPDDPSLHGRRFHARQQRYSIGEQMRRLLKLVAARSAEGMRNRVGFLNAWG